MPDKHNNSNSRTVTRAFRITHTQDFLLDREQRINSSASAIVRVLLSLYFNNRIPEAKLMIEAELEKAAKAQKERIDRARKTA